MFVFLCKNVCFDFLFSASFNNFKLCFYKADTNCSSITNTIANAFCTSEYLFHGAH